MRREIGDLERPSRQADVVHRTAVDQASHGAAEDTHGCRPPDRSCIEFDPLDDPTRPIDGDQWRRRQLGTRVVHASASCRNDSRECARRRTSDRWQDEWRIGRRTRKHDDLVAGCHGHECVRDRLMRRDKRADERADVFLVLATLVWEQMTLLKNYT